MADDADKAPGLEDLTAAETYEIVARAGANHRTTSKEEREQLLLLIRDHSLSWWAECVMSKRAKGMSAAQEAYRDSVVELERLSMEGQHGEAQGGQWAIYFKAPPSAQADA